MNKSLASPGPRSVRRLPLIMLALGAPKAPGQKPHRRHRRRSIHELAGVGVSVGLYDGRIQR